jgi:hypothetical protein
MGNSPARGDAKNIVLLVTGSNIAPAVLRAAASLEA